MNKQIYEFEAFLLDLEQKRLKRNGQPVALQPKVFDLLVFFVEKNDELVSRDEIMKAVWADTFVEESNLRFCIHALRKALGKNAEGKDYVVTIPKRGYRFTAELRKETSEIFHLTEIYEKIAPPQIIEKQNPVKRNWLIGIAAFSIICFVFFLIAWQKNNNQLPENAPGFQQLAVLPFTSANENKTEFQINLADAMITDLSKLSQIKVLPIAEIRKFAGQKFDASNAAKELGADAYLTGNYRVDDAKIHVSLNLIRVADGENIWTENITVDKSVNLNLESAISLRTARLFSLKIADSEEEKLLAAQKNLNAEAVQNYLSARKIWRRNELFRRNEMVGLFEKTIAVEPNWALAYAGYAEALTAEDQSFIKWEHAAKIAEKAVELDKTLAAPHAILGEVYQWRDWNWEAAEGEFKQAVALEPDNASARFKYSKLLRLQRRFAETKTELQKAAKIEPFSPTYQTAFSELYLSNRKFDKAFEACKNIEQIEPDFWLNRKVLYQIYIEKKMFTELGEMVLGKLSPVEKSAHPLTKASAENDLRLYFQYLLNAPTKGDQENLVPKAAIYLQLGETEKALENLEAALTKRDESLPIVNADSRFDAIRNEKRFAEIIRKIGLQK